MRPRATHVEDWRDEVIYQLLVDRFADGDPGNNYHVDRTALARYQGGDWQGVDRPPRLLRGARRHHAVDLAGGANVETDADFDGYHGYWAAGLTQPNPHFGDLAGCASMVDAGARREASRSILDIVTNHMGQLFYYDINLNGQPDENVYGGGEQRLRSGGCTSPSRTSTEYDPDFDPRGVQALHLARLSRARRRSSSYMPEIARDGAAAPPCTTLAGILSARMATTARAASLPTTTTSPTSRCSPATSPAA